jgi:hypothetical protein
MHGTECVQRLLPLPLLALFFVLLLLVPSRLLRPFYCR